MKISRVQWLGVLAGAVAVALALVGAFAQNGGSASDNLCSRFPVGSTVADPPNLFSRNGVLSVNLSYRTGVDRFGNTQFCYLTPDNKQSPTLHVNPGDTLVLALKNDTPKAAPSTAMAMSGTVCGNAMMDASSTNVHYHGTNTSPTCHQDEVIHTMVNSGETFTYRLQFPSDEPPGLYWYHPHVHGIAEAAVQGGASGAIIVEGIQNLQPAVAGMPERVLVVRDNPVPGSPTDPTVPAWDVSLNYIPIPFPNYPPAVIKMRAGEKQFWRMVNASADTIVDIQLQYDGRPQPLQIVGLDGVPTGSQDGSRRGKLITKTDILIPPAGRAEFIVSPPSSRVKSAQLLTLNVDTGPLGDSDPQRPLADIKLSQNAADEPALSVPAAAAFPNPQRFEGLASASPVKQRTLYFSEVVSDPSDPSSPTNFFITEDGATPVLFDPNNPPEIVTTQGSVEDWTIQNRAEEHHEFHMHQIHFLLLERNGVPVWQDDQQFLDMVQVPFWTGSGPYPSVKVRMDFRGRDIGDFVYHCHILGHEDNGMMAIIRVLPSNMGKAGDPKPARGGHPARHIRKSV